MPEGNGYTRWTATGRRTTGKLPQRLSIQALGSKNVGETPQESTKSGGNASPKTGRCSANITSLPRESRFSHFIFHRISPWIGPLISFPAAPWRTINTNIFSHFRSCFISPLSTLSPPMPESSLRTSPVPRPTESSRLHIFPVPQDYGARP